MGVPMWVCPCGCDHAGVSMWVYPCGCVLVGVSVCAHTCGYVDVGVTVRGCVPMAHNAESACYWEWFPVLLAPHRCSQSGHGAQRVHLWYSGQRNVHG